jgi:hypothetical protein
MIKGVHILIIALKFLRIMISNHIYKTEKILNIYLSQGKQNIK